MNILQNYPLKHLNTFGIDVSTEYFSAFKNEQELSEVLKFAVDKNISGDDVLILGGGSNILFTKNYTGIVLKNESSGIVRTHEDDRHVYLKASAGVPWHEFVTYCIDNGLAGAENLSLIPGSVGASPMQNIGAYGVELKDIFYELEAYHREDGRIIKFSNEDCAFDYRESVFKNKLKGQFVIMSVTFRLNKKPVYNVSYGAIESELLKEDIHTLSIKAISEAVIRIRTSKLPDPKVIGNAGSFFKNPTISNNEFEKLKALFPTITGYAVNKNETKLAAGWLIEQCGWKGFRRGDAGCHVNQALVLVNYKDAKGEEILQLSEEIIASVKEKFAVSLQREVNIV